MTKPREPFGCVPTWVLRDPSVSPQAKALLALLCTYADGRGKCWPSNATLANRLGVTTRSVRKWISELVAVGALTRERQFRDGLETVSATGIVRRRGERTFLPGGNDRSHRTTPVEQHQSTPPSFGQVLPLYSGREMDQVGSGSFPANGRDWTDADLAALPNVEALNKIVFGDGA